MIEVREIEVRKVGLRTYRAYGWAYIYPNDVLADHCTHRERRARDLLTFASHDPRRWRVRRPCNKDGSFKPSTHWHLSIESHGYYIPANRVKHEGDPCHECGHSAPGHHHNCCAVD